MRFCVKFMMLLLFNFCFSQYDSHYVGVVKLNDTSVISYRIEFKEKNGMISGFSITDIGGAHETKSRINGFYNKENKMLSFREEGIVYTKSPITQDDFCFVNFKGKLKKINNNKGIKGRFKGLYENGEECISGEIILSNLEKLTEKAEKIEKRIDRSKLIKEEVKQQVNLVASLDSLKINFIKKDEELSFFTESSKILLVVHDAGKQDGDKINLYLDKKELLKNFVISPNKKQLNIELVSHKNTLLIEALNNGEIAPNTVHLEIIDDKNNVRVLTNLNKGEKALLTIIKK